MNKVVAIALIVSALAIIVLYEKSNPEIINTAQITPAQNAQRDQDCTPAFADGGGPYYKPNSPFRNTIAPDNHSGETLVVSGKLLASDCQTPIPNAVIDLWQANENGNYDDIWYRGKIKTDNEGTYAFQTVVPKGYGEGTGYRPPHIHFKVFLDDIEVITSQMFFPESRGRPGFDNAYIMSLEREESNGFMQHRGYHDIILP